MQQSPCFNSLSPEENSKLFPSIQRFNNGLCSPRTLFFGLGLSSSGQNSFSNKNLLSKIKFSSSNKKQFFNNSNMPFLSNKRHYLSETSDKNINKTDTNNKNINKMNQVLNTKLKNEESITESQNDGKKTKASSKKFSAYIPPQNGEASNINYNNYNYGYITNSSFNKSAYIGSVKKNLLPSLSNELKSNIKTKNQYNNEKNNRKNNINSTSNKNNNFINKYNISQSQKKDKNNINTSNKKTTNDSTQYDYLLKITESLDLEKMVDYIVSSTKIYNRYNDNKENNSNNLNNIININEEDENNRCKNNINYIFYSDIKNIKKSKKNISKNNNKSINDINNIGLNTKIDNQKGAYSICKCKKVECLKYSCSCLKSGNRCTSLCSCKNCKNKESNNIFQIDE